MKIINFLQNLEKKYHLNKNELVIDLVAGLIGGLGIGLVFNLSNNLLWGLIFSLFMGSIASLIGGLIVGLVTTLGSIVSIILIASIKYFPFKIWILIIGVIICAEIIFLWFDISNPKKRENKFWFTIKRKGITYLELIFIILELNGLFQLSIRGYPYIKKYFPEIVKLLGYIGIGIICLIIVLAILYRYIKLNSLKYKKRRVIQNEWNNND